MKKSAFFVVPFLAMAFPACGLLDPDDPQGEEEEVWTDDTPAIEFKDPEFLKALLLVQDVWGYDPETDGDTYYRQDIDKNKDGQISEKEAAHAEAVFLWDVATGEHFNISDMSGLGYFTSLKVLDCSQSGLKTIDVSANTKLVDLKCSENSLETIDLSGNTALAQFVCGGNMLTELDLSENTAMRRLYCENNQIRSLDVSGCLRLADLECGGNPLLTLYVSKEQEHAEWLNDFRQIYSRTRIIVK